ncbi:MAG: ECF transporter S component [Peptostreptococcales bacterium]
MKTQKLTLGAVCVAIVFICTYIIQIKLPLPGQGGLVHAGNIAMFSICLILGKWYGATAGAFGMAIFDLISGWAIWAPGTFVIRFVSGYVIGHIAHINGENGKNKLLNLIGLSLGSVIIIIGYYLYEVMLYRNWFVPLSSIPGDITQCVLGAIVAMILSQKNVGHVQYHANTMHDNIRKI